MHLPRARANSIATQMSNSMHMPMPETSTRTETASSGCKRKMFRKGKQNGRCGLNPVKKRCFVPPRNALG
eukprot:2094158-Lingulodinium_polyedra.AAC.1